MPIRFFKQTIAILASTSHTSGAVGAVEVAGPGGAVPPLHVHHREDEAFYVLEGDMAFVCDGDWTIAGPGTYVFGPRNIPHGFKVQGTSPARMLLLCAPGGFEQFALELSEPEPAPGVPPAPPDMAKLATVAAKYRIDILGPLPD
jgi:quercetin dioxygenase-like cupin family protein